MKPKSPSDFGAPQRRDTVALDQWLNEINGLTGRVSRPIACPFLDSLCELTGHVARPPGRSMMGTGTWDGRISGYWAFTHMAPLGISLIAIGVVLVCAGLEFWRRMLRTEPAVLEDPMSFERSSMP